MLLKKGEKKHARIAQLSVSRSRSPHPEFGALKGGLERPPSPHYRPGRGPCGPRRAQALGLRARTSFRPQECSGF